MNTIEMKNFATLRALRRWYDSLTRKVFPDAARPASVPSVAPPAPAPSCPPVPERVAVSQAKPDALTNAQRWYDQQTKPCTIAVYINATTAQPVRFHVLNDKAVQELFAGPAYNTPNTDWEVVNPHCLRRRDCDLATLLGEQESSLCLFEDLLAARWCSSQDLTKLYDQSLRNWATAFPDAEDAPHISAQQRQQALAQFGTTLLECGAALKSLVALDESLVAACHMLGVPLPDDYLRQRPSAKLAKVA